MKRNIFLIRFDTFRGKLRAEDMQIRVIGVESF